MYTKRNMAGMGERRCSGLFMDFDQEDDELLDIPTKRLSLQVMYTLATKLPTCITSPGNWIEVAERLGYGRDHIQEFIHKSKCDGQHPGYLMLMDWSSEEIGRSVYVLRETLKQCGRSDCGQYLHDKVKEMNSMELYVKIKNATTGRTHFITVHAQCNSSLKSCLYSVLEGRFDDYEAEVPWTTPVGQFKGRHVSLCRTKQWDPTLSVQCTVEPVCNRGRDPDDIYNNLDLNLNRSMVNDVDLNISNGGTNPSPAGPRLKRKRTFEIKYEDTHGLTGSSEGAVDSDIGDEVVTSTTSDMYMAMAAPINDPDPDETTVKYIDSDLSSNEIDDSSTSSNFVSALDAHYRISEFKTDNAADNITEEHFTTTSAQLNQLHTFDIERTQQLNFKRDVEETQKLLDNQNHLFKSSISHRPINTSASTLAYHANRYSSNENVFEMSDIHSTHVFADNPMNIVDNHLEHQTFVKQMDFSNDNAVTEQALKFRNIPTQTRSTDIDETSRLTIGSINMVGHTRAKTRNFSDSSESTKSSTSQSSTSSTSTNSRSRDMLSHSLNQSGVRSRKCSSESAHDFLSQTQPLVSTNSSLVSSNIFGSYMNIHPNKQTETAMSSSSSNPPSLPPRNVRSIDPQSQTQKKPDTKLQYIRQKLHGVVGWNPLVTDNKAAVSKMTEFRHMNGYYLLWYMAREKTLVITVSHLGKLVHFGICMTKDSQGRLQYSIYEEERFFGIEAMLTHYSNHDLRHVDERKQISRIRLHRPIM